MSKRVRAQRQKAKEAAREKFFSIDLPPGERVAISDFGGTRYTYPGVYIQEDLLGTAPRLPEPEAEDFTNVLRTVEFLQRCMEAAFERFVYEPHTPQLATQMEMVAREILEHAVRIDIVFNDVDVIAHNDNQSILCYFTPTAGGPRRVMEINTGYV
jgi:hypothetical protein